MVHVTARNRSNLTLMLHNLINYILQPVINVNLGFLFYTSILDLTYRSGGIPIWILCLLAFLSVDHALDLDQEQGRLEI